METILEVIHTNADGSEVKVSLTQKELKYYMAVLQFDPSASDGLTNAEVKNMSQYGWYATVQTNYQTLENDLRTAIENELGRGRKAECIVIFSHGGQTRSDKHEESSYVNTNHHSKAKLSGFSFKYLKRLDEEIPNESDEKEKEYNGKMEKLFLEKKSIEIRIKIREETSLSVDEINHLTKHKDSKVTDKDIQRLKVGKSIDLKEGKDDKYADWREKDAIENKMVTLTKEYNDYKVNISDEITKIETHYVTDQTRRDIQSLDNIISLIENGGSLVLAACNSALRLGNSSKANVPLLMEIFNHYFCKINILGVEYLSAYISSEKQIGLIDGDINIKQEGGFSIVNKVKNTSNTAFEINSSGEVSVINDIKIVKNGIEKQ